MLNLMLLVSWNISVAFGAFELVAFVILILRVILQAFVNQL